MSASFALGAMLFGTSVPEDTAFDLLDRFVDGGGTLIDTANCYAFWVTPEGAGGQSEKVIGRWLRARPGMRDRVQLATKVGVEPVSPGGPAEGLSAPVIRQAITDSLTRLGTDRVDMYFAHMEDRATPLADTTQAFAEVVAEGLTARIGASNHALWRVEQSRQLALASGAAPFTALQLSYSYVTPRAFSRPAAEMHRFGRVTDEVLDYVTEHPDLDLWAYSPLLGGGYDRPERPFDQVFQHPGTDRRLAAIASVAGDLGVSRSQVVLAWMTTSTPSITPIVGVSSVRQLDDALAGVALPLDAAQMSVLDVTR